ncbi:hypothetical protein OAS14_00785 [Alphaproteobacteria bacterium]|nr:hypothetical protein [Alphaproteobacteria bacterium]
MNYSTSDLQEAKRILKTLGFVLIKGFAPNVELILALTRDARNYIDKAVDIKFLKDGHYTYYSAGKPELWGVDNFLSFLSKSSMDDFHQLKLIKCADSLLDGVVCSSLNINRVHFQNSDFLHKLAWHHDQEEFNQALVANLYLERESGFRITPKDHFLNNREVSHNRIGNGFLDLIKDFVTIHAEPGDLLLFDGKLLHQPYNESTRLHLHFAFNLSKSSDVDQKQDIFSDDNFSFVELFEIEDRYFKNMYILKAQYFLKVAANFFEKRFFNVA